MGNTIGPWKSSKLRANIYKSLFDYSAIDIDGSLVNLSKFKSSKALLVVNVASKCGTTKPYYAALVNLRHQLREEVPNGNFEILAFPCGQFAGQEFATSKEIKTFVSQFNVDFPMFEKIEVNGPGTNEIFQFLKYNTPELSSSSDIPTLGAIGWNFGKFLIDGEGHVVKYYGPRVNPMDTKSDCLKVLKGELSGHSRTPPVGGEVMIDESPKKESCET